MASRAAIAILCLLVWLPGHAATVAITVVDAASGRPLAGATAYASGTARITAADGKLAVPAAAGGAATAMSVTAPGYARAETTLRDGDAARIVRMMPLRPKAVYLSAFGVANRALRDAVLALPGKTAINALVIDVKGDDGATPYRSAARESIGAAAVRRDAAPRAIDLSALVRALHARGLYLIARIVVFKDDPLAAAHPDWAVRDAAGAVWRDRERQRWIDPTVRGAWEHHYDLAEEAARMGFDEIQFDYLRFPDANGLRFGEPNTESNRVAAITGFLMGARARLRPYNVYLSVDIFGYVCWNSNDTRIGQRLETLGRTVDYISPMLYPSGFAWGVPGVRKPTERPGEIVRRSLAKAMRRTGLAGVRFRPWLQAFRDYAFDRRTFGADEIRVQIDAAEAAGTDGWMVWNPHNRYDSAALPH
ncbi:MULTISPECIES: putative glycoside hydrolase [Burkholderia]|uniref:putative glycoside hydrolase n=1 Tax=Burkholderia TaxID=32008 RepID=UPI000327EE77|nr:MULTISPECIES: putative glycoside hydrolase [Burkholderia]AGK49692.1 putative glycosyl hydrolase domain protein [Burkholderia thailandensis MSMB121]ATF33827.1 GTP-binding protein [Burkholderia thailandensis]KST71910.1 GTP-binding protein [Burkholderia humptydooensis]KVN06830.1 GTP-binding protein [Burkholderia sp. MSMB1552]KWZ51465.1 GTP-binding protein [Burkholderia sp. MSMB1588]